MNTPNDEADDYANFEKIKTMMSRFDIEINDIKKTNKDQFKLDTSHKKAVLFSSKNNDMINFDFLTCKEGKIESQYPVNPIIQKVIDYGNQQIDFFNAIRLLDLRTNKMHSYIDSIKCFIDFEFEWVSPEKHEIVLNFSHTKSQMCQLISNQTMIATGAYHSMHIVFNLDGDMTVNRLNVHRRRVFQAWDNVIEKDFKEYGLLTEMAHI